MSIKDTIKILLAKRQLIDNAIVALQLIDGDDLPSKTCPDGDKGKYAGCTPNAARGRKSQLNDEQKEEIWKRHQNDEKAAALAEEYGVGVSTIYNLVCAFNKEHGNSKKKK